MKKFVCVCFTMMAIMMILMTSVALADYWDVKTIEWLEANTVSWCEEHGFEDWIDMHHFSEDGDFILGHSVITDVTPEEIHNLAQCEAVKEAEQEIGLKIKDVNLIHYGTEGGYDIYRLIIRFVEGMTTSEEYGSRVIYGEDLFVRFYN